MKNKNGYLFITLIIILILIIILFSRCSCNNQQPTNKNYNLNYNLNYNFNANINQENPFPDLSGCVIEVVVDYHSTLKVKNEADAAKIFKEYITWAQANHKEVFPEKGNDWQFQSAEPHGIYQNIKYWQITALWFSGQQQQWLPQTVFDVSEDGQVVRLLGCL